MQFGSNIFGAVPLAGLIADFPPIIHRGVSIVAPNSKYDQDGVFTRRTHPFPNLSIASSYPRRFQFIKSKPEIEQRDTFTRAISPRLDLPRFIVFKPRIVRPENFEQDWSGHPRSVRPNMIDFGRRQAAARGLYRIFNAAEFRFYRSNSVPPEPGDTPFATNATLPHQPSDLFADGTWYLSVSYFNGVIDSGFLPVGPHGETYLTMIIDSGEDEGLPPGLPHDVQLVLRPNGVIRVHAFYLAVPDGSNRANRWAIAYTTNGSTPATDTPDVVEVMRAGPLAILAVDLPAQAHGTTVKVRVQTRRTTEVLLPTPGETHVYSEAGPVFTAIADASGPSAPLDLRSWSGALPERF